MLTTSDYRNSHLDPQKGVEYHQKFSKNPHRTMIWEIEKTVLDDILRTFFTDTKIRHLDFACGTGRIIEHCQSRASESVGVDVSESMLDVARGRLIDCELLNADITCNDVLKDKKFNLITAFRFFPNAQDELRKSASASLVSHLASDGYLVFNNHKNYSSLSYRLGRLLSGRDLGEMRESEVREMLSWSGLTIVRTYHMGVIPSTDKYRVAPIPLLGRAERFLSRFASLRSLATNVIYVCVRTK